MPSVLRFHERDPDNAGRGPGWYYRRAMSSRSFNPMGLLYSKSSAAKDAKEKKGPMSVGGDLYRHAHDYRSYHDSPAYPTNLESYDHERRPKTEARFKQTQHSRRRFRNFKRFGLQ